MSETSSAARELTAAQQRAVAELVRVSPVADELGRRFGAARKGLRLEITTFRAEAYDRVTRNPVVRYGTNLLDDLRRRDFAVNAMAVSVPGHVFTDPYGGLNDLT